MQHQNGGVLKAFLFDALLADGHLDDIIEFSFSISVVKEFEVLNFFTGHLDDIIEFSQGEKGPQL